MGQIKINSWCVFVVHYTCSL